MYPRLNTTGVHRVAWYMVTNVLKEYAAWAEVPQLEELVTTLRFTEQVF
jgi:hypothetical protein